MPRTTALPFFLKRSTDVIGSGGITSTAETIHGLLRLEPDRLVIQWRLARQVDRVGPEIRTDHEVEPLQEVVVPLQGVAGGAVRRSWWPWARTARLVLTAADLRAFEALVGPEGIRLDHPAEVVLRIRRRDVEAAWTFAADLSLAVADLALDEADPTLGRAEGERGRRLAPPEPGGES